MSHDPEQAAHELLSYTENLLTQEEHETITAKSLLVQLRNIDLNLPWREVAEEALKEQGKNPPKRGHVQMIALGLRDALQSCITH